MPRPKGIPMSEAAKQKLREYWSDPQRTQSHRRSMSEAAKQRDLTKSFHSTEAISRATEARKSSPACRQPKGPMSDEHKQAISQAKKGKPKPLSWRRSMSLSRQGEKTSWWWKGGIHEQNQKERTRAMRRFEYRAWREQVLQRDNHTCVMKDETCSGPLQVDHIKPWKDYPELRYDINNGRTLCKSHHERTPTFAGRVFRKHQDKETV